MRVFLGGERNSWRGRTCLDVHCFHAGQAGEAGNPQRNQCLEERSREILFPGGRYFANERCEKEGVGPSPCANDPGPCTGLSRLPAPAQKIPTFMFGAPRAPSPRKFVFLHQASRNCALKRCISSRPPSSYCFLCNTSMERDVFIQG